MTTRENNIELLREVCKGNEDALIFLRHLQEVCHAVDDLVDAPSFLKPEPIIKAFLNTIGLFGANPFFRKHADNLLPLVLIGVNHYAQSEEWVIPRGAEEIVRSRTQMADHMRSSMNIVLEFVALLCGGPDHLRAMTPKIWDESWKAHHDENGKPI